MTSSKSLHYFVMCVSRFAKAKHISPKDAYNFLKEFKGMDFLEECYESEHCLSLDDAVDDLTAVCKNNGGMVE